MTYAHRITSGYTLGLSPSSFGTLLPTVATSHIRRTLSEILPTISKAKVKVTLGDRIYE